MSTLIKAAEIWLPSADHSLLEFGGGLFGAATRFGASSRALCFARGEGLPGRAWDEARPIVLKQLSGSYFRRSAAALEAGFTCAVAVPVFVREHLSAVLVLFCGGDGAHDGAIELWRHSARVSSDMTLVDGYFGTEAIAFEASARDAYLPRGSGLPGMAWQRGSAVLMDDVATAGKFMRTDMAAEAGINRGLAFPCDTPSSDAHVLALLSTTLTPIAQRIECWAPDATHQALHRTFGHCETAGPLHGLTSHTVLGGAIGKAFASGVPVINEAARTEPNGVGTAALAAQLGSLLAWPVVSDGEVSEVLALYF